MKIEEAIRLSRDLRFIGQTFNDATRTIGDTTQATKSVKRIFGCCRGDDLSSKLIAIGAACVIFPEPFISDIVGSALLAAGMLAKKRRGLTVNDIFKEAGRSMSFLRNFNMEL